MAFGKNISLKKNLVDKTDKTRKKIANEEFSEIIRITWEHRKTLSELAKH